MKIASLASVVILVAFFIVTPSSIAQSSAQNNQPGGGFATPPIQVEVTGCVKRGVNGGYYIKDQNGHVWGLVSSKVNLSGQVEHSVSITGKPAALLHPQETQPESGQQTGTEGNHSTNLQVLTLKMLSPSCTR
jgi:hypothetical protein